MSAPNVKSRMPGTDPKKEKPAPASAHTILSTLEDIDRERLMGLLKQIEDVESQIDALAETPSATRLVPWFDSQAFEFPKADYSTKQKTFSNGADDVYVCGLAYFATMQTLDANNAVVSSDFLTNIGPFLRAVNVGGDFDFQWNMRLLSTSADYLSSANGAQLLSRKALGNYERGEPLVFRTPQRVRGGDALTYLMRATLHAGSQSDGSVTWRVLVNMVAFGYRSGVMGESAFDPLED